MGCRVQTRIFQDGCDRSNLEEIKRGNSSSGEGGVDNRRGLRRKVSFDNGVHGAGGLLDVRQYFAEVRCSYGGEVG